MPELRNDGRLYGVTMNGGEAGLGTVFGVILDGTGFAVLHEFLGPDGSAPYAGLLEVGNELFGLARTGGSGGAGTAFRVGRDGGFCLLHEFYLYGEGAYPTAPLIQGLDGNLYGTAYTGGAVYGQVFRLSPSGEVTDVHTFIDSDGAFPAAALVLDGNGALLGTASTGGAYAGGSVFRDRAGSVHERLGHRSILGACIRDGRVPHELRRGRLPLRFRRDAHRRRDAGAERGASRTNS